MLPELSQLRYSSEQGIVYQLLLMLLAAVIAAVERVAARRTQQTAAVGALSAALHLNRK